MVTYLILISGLILIFLGCYGLVRLKDSEKHVKTYSTILAAGVIMTASCVLLMLMK